jgi:hypothetical protein
VAIRFSKPVRAAAVAVTLLLALVLWFRYRAQCACAPSAASANAGTLRAVPYVLPAGSLIAKLDTRPIVLDCEPPPNHVAVHRIDESLLVVIPSSTAANFRHWLEAERKDMDWIRQLPPAYAHIGPNGTNPEPEACTPRMWPTLRKINNYLHPGAAHEMRSAPQPDGSGHQATYNAHGELLRIGLAAGSADRASPQIWNPLTLIAHRDRDVLPFYWAAQLDGNPVNPTLFSAGLDGPIAHVGEHLRQYATVRPTFGPSQRELQPGVCVDGHAPATH